MSSGAWQAHCPMPEGLSTPKESLSNRVSNAVRRSAAFRDVVSSAFRGLQALGVSVTPVHFYFPVPNLKTLEASKWMPSDRPGIDFDIPGALSRLSRWMAYHDEWTFSHADQPYNYHYNNGFFETVDAEIAYSIVREAKPARIIEIGGGNSTRLLATALRKNALEEHPGTLISIEPHPDPVLRKGFPGLTELAMAHVQDMPLQIFDTLEAGDILFVDSSHVVSIGSDVVHEILSILPRLKPGVIIHFHDIFLPAEYPKKFVMKNLCFWGEQYMLEAFLSFNSKFRVLWGSSAMQFHHPEVLAAAFPQWPNSFAQMPESLKIFAPTVDGESVWPCSLWVERQA
jgi:hypothetical protein